MKLFNRQDFMKLPEGVIYVEGVQWALGGLYVKGETITFDGKDEDWCCLDLLDIDCDDHIQRIDRYEEMLEKGASYPMNSASGRDGMFNADAVFLVFEESDIETLRYYMDVASKTLSIEHKRAKE